MTGGVAQGVGPGLKPSSTKKVTNVTKLMSIIVFKYFIIFMYKVIMHLEITV
jgi:hypothetical protein